MFVFAAIAVAAAVVVRVEILVAAHYRRSVEALFAADAAVDAVVAELRALPDWTPVVGGALRSAQSQGAFQGSMAVPGGGAVLVCCGPGSAAGRLSTDTQLSPLPARRALQWRPFLWAPFDALAPRFPPSRLFVVVWVGNDEDDRDGGESTDTNRTVIVRSEALEAGGNRRIVEALVGRQPADGGLYSGGSASKEESSMRVGILRWREVR
ncbi:MAG: hypothetical protein ACRD15_12990 [Vicinamibacterales bacterium]